MTTQANKASFLKVLTLTLGVALVAGCTSIVRSKVTAFNALDEPISGSVFITAQAPEVAKSLEFEHYRKAAAAQVGELGLTPTDNSERADYVLSLGFAVGEMRLEDSGLKTAVMVRTTPWRSFGSDVVLVEDDRGVEYKRSLSVVLTERSAEQPVYEATATSIGSCDVMAVVFDEMFSAIVKSYPQASGSVSNVAVKGDVRC